MAVSLLLLIGSAANAAEVRFDGAYQLRFNGNSDYLLDPQQRLGQTAWAEHRLRITPKIVEPERVEIQAQFDVVSGLIAGDLAPVMRGLGWTERSERNGTDPRGFDFRYLFAALRLPVGLLQFGQMPNHWGMGLVANSGEGMGATDFGDMRFGDIVDGFLFGTRPLAFLGPRSDLAQHVVGGFAGYVIYRDRYASLVTRTGDGLGFSDVALQGVVFARWEPTDVSRAGIYIARRVQSYAHDQGNLHVWVFDAHARTQIFFPSAGASLRLEFEGAEFYGGTSHGANLNTGNIRVAQQGLVGRATFTRGDTEIELEAGFASGDQNPYDDVATGFAANRDYKVGLVLWDEVMLFQTQNSAKKLSDPGLAGRPPASIDLLPTEGAVTNAIYLNPRLRWRPAVLDRRLSTVVGVLWARAPEPVADPYSSFFASAPRNVFGMPAGRNYGTEVDLGASLRLGFTQDRQVGLELGAQYGVLFPGDVFTIRNDGSKLSSVHAFKFRSTLFF